MKARPYQLEAIRGIFEAWNSSATTLLVMPTGCHARGQRVLGADGASRAVELVKVGDQLLGAGGSPRTVLFTHTGVAELYRVVPVKGEPFVVTGDHKLTLVRTREAKARRCRDGLVDVTVAEWLTWPKYRKHIHKLVRSPAQFDQRYQEPWYKRVHVPPYLLGVLLGDGSFRTNLSLTSMDEPIVRSAAELLAPFGLRLSPGTTCGAAVNYLMRAMRRGQRSAHEFRKWLRLLGLDMLLSGEKFIPHVYKIAPRQDRLELLAGLMDTDGSDNGGCGFDYISKSERLAHDVTFVARSLGLAAYCKPCQKYCQNGNGGTYHRVSISGHVDQVPCRVPRKRLRPRRQKKNVLRTGLTIEPAGTGEYFGFTVDRDNRYLLDDFTITHNCGKTVVLAHVIKERPPGRAMLLAHREELIWQGANKIEAVTGERPEVEMAEFVANTSLMSAADVVVSSIQTQNAGEGGAGRMTRFDPSEFSLLIVDEAHHVTAPSYRRVIDYYRQNPNLKVLGVTATPDRADEQALGQVFETVAFDYELVAAINDGWLVPIRQRAVVVEGLDYSSVRTTAGDLNGADLAAVMEYEETLHRIAGPTVELIGNRRALVFAASVAHAERLSEIFNRYRPSCSCWVCGKTPKEDRRRMFSEYARGRFTILVNVGVATEGFDDPGIEVIVMARPTKSRSLYAQMAGRGTRPLPGLVDRWETADQRRLAISSSAKPFVEVIDFVGNCGRHKLITTADILGGNYSDDVVERAAKKAQEAGGPIDMAEALVESEREIEEEKARARRLALRVKAQYKTSVVDPFETLEIEPWVERGWNKGKPPTEKQVALLEKWGVATSEVKSITQARQLIDTLIHRRQAELCTYKQAALLARFGYDTKVTFDEARSIIDNLAKNGWRRPSPPSPAPVKVY